MWQAKLLADLDDVTGDLGALDANLMIPELPRELAAPSPTRLPAAQRITGGTGPTFSLAVMGGSDRLGRWVVPASHTAFALMGGVTIDLREAIFAAAETTIYAFAMMGGIEIIVPGDVDVEVNGVGVMGGFGREDDRVLTTNITPGAPRVTITGVALMGSVSVKRLDPGAPLK